MLISQVTLKVAGVAVFRADFLMTNTALRAAQRSTAFHFRPLQNQSASTLARWYFV